MNDDPQKTNCLTTVQKDNMVAVTVKKGEAVCVASRGRYTREDGGAEQHLEVQVSGKSNTLTTIQKDRVYYRKSDIETTSNEAKEQLVGERGRPSCADRV